MKLARLKDRLILALPDRGMPLIVSCFDSIGDNLEGWETVLARSSRINGMDQAVPSAVYLPMGGMGFFGWPAIQGHRNGKHFVLYPGGWTAEETQNTLVLSGADPEADIALRLEFQMHDVSMLRMRTQLTNKGNTPYTLDRCMAGTILIEGGAESVSTLGGGWGREFHINEQTLSSGLWLQESRRGRTSHDRYPGIAVRSTTPTIYGIHLGWSGNHVIAIDRIDDGQSLVHAGELFEPGEMILAPGETYESPFLYAAREIYGDAFDLWPVFHETVRQEILKWPGGAMKPRPVILNTWEGSYFAHDFARLKAQATAAAALGIERFVLDDGWFGKRDNDTSGLGDWFVDKRKYPDGLTPLINHVTGLGMEFGIWIEPEMVNPDSELYQNHPDWALQVEGKPLLLSRNQLVLDLTRGDVVDFLFSRLNWLLGSHAISYIKWDMNRDLTHAGGHNGRAAVSRQTHAVYALIDRVRAAHPAVEIESCASGGGRADYGVLQRTHRVWVSDCTDALERLYIQQGARRFLPPEIMGCHISASPNHQTQRRHSLSFRAIVAFFGHLGIELGPTKLTDDEQVELAAWIALHKSLRSVLHHPSSTSLDQYEIDGRHVFGVKLDNDDLDEEHFVIGIAQAVQPMREQPEPLHIPVYHTYKNFTVKQIGPGSQPFVRSTAIQREMLAGKIMSGHWIASRGLPIPQLYPESAILLEIKTAEAKHG
jgi:alpha-galactosidase